jgi:cytoskeleton protein RodZ
MTPEQPDRGPQIGSVLKETRKRQGIDIRTVEEMTKIRIKYLRALENEEWDTLPGPAYARAFLRTYAELLGLDGEALVDE